MRRFLAAYRLPLLLLGGILVGTLVGLLVGERAVAVRPAGDLFLNLMFTLVVPLVFFSVSSAVASMSGLVRLGRIAWRMLVVFAATGLLAALVALIVVRLVPPEAGVTMSLGDTPQPEQISIADQLVRAFSVPEFADLLSRRNLLALIVFSGLFGLAVVLVGDKARPVANTLSAASDVLLRMTTVVMWLAPIGLGACFAAMVGEHGPQLAGSYLRAAGLYYPVSLLYFAVFFTLYAWVAAGREGPRLFWRAIPTAAITAFASGSSVATIPANLEASRSVGVPRDVRELIVPLGATIHMDGSAISAIFKIAFLSSVFGLPFEGAGDMAFALVVALLSAVVMSGIPGGGLIGEMLIITLYGFPPGALPLLAVLGALVDPPATMVNATGDTVAGMLVARWLDGPRWCSAQREEAS